MLLLSLLNRAWWRVSMLRGERLGYLQLICILHLIYIFNKKNAAMRCGLKVCVWFPTQPIPCMRSLHVLTCLLVELGVELLFWMERIMECWCWGSITAHCCFLLPFFPGSFTLSISCCLSRLFRSLNSLSTFLSSSHFSLKFSPSFSPLSNFLHLPSPHLSLNLSIFLSSSI